MMSYEPIKSSAISVRSRASSGTVADIDIAFSKVGASPWLHPAAGDLKTSWDIS